MTEFGKTFGEFSSTTHGLIVSSILPTAALSALVAGIFADKYGRVRLIILGSCIFGIGAAIECASVKLPMFIVGRLIKGVGEGQFLSTTFVQVAEISPTRGRGVVSSFPQFSTVCGLVMGFFICYGTTRIEGTSLSWRLPMALASFMAFAFAALCALVPPSPRWLLAKGRVDEARAVVGQLGLDPEEQEELLAQSSSGLEHAVDVSLVESLRQTFAEFGQAFSPAFRARTAFGCFIMAFQQLAGIDGVLYYAPILFREAGLSSEKATFLASGVSALVIMGVTIPATIFVDHWGRRTSSLLGGVLITAIMLIIGSLYAADEVHSDRGAGRWVVIVCIYLFAVVFSATWAIGFRIFLVESLPRKTRSSASSLAQCSNWVSFNPKFWVNRFV